MSTTGPTSPATQPASSTNPGTTLPATSNPVTTSPVSTSAQSSSSPVTTPESSQITTAASSSVTSSQSSTTQPGSSSEQSTTNPASSSRTTAPVSTGSSSQITTGPSSSSPTSSPTTRPGQTSYVYTTITDSNGQTSTSAVAESGNTGGSSTNTGAIVGGVVGGVVGLALLVALLVFCWRRKKRAAKDDFDDMMFDPARGGRHAPPGTTDLIDPSGQDVEPYTYGQPEMSQYAAESKGGVVPGLPTTGEDGGYNPGAGAYAAAGAGAAIGAGAGAASRGSRSDGGYTTTDGHGANVNRAPSGSTFTSAGFAGRGANNNYYNDGGDGSDGMIPPMPMPMPMPTPGSSNWNSSDPTDPTSTAATTPSTAASRKAREAQMERMRANGGVDAEVAASSAAGASPLTGTTDGTQTSSDNAFVHSDAGRYIEEAEPQEADELPPQYHSIPEDRR